MLYITHSNYRHFIPSAPPLNFYLPYYISGTKFLYYNTVASDDTGIVKLPTFFNMVYGSPSVLCNNIDLKGEDFQYNSYFLTIASYYEIQVTEVPNPNSPSEPTLQAETVQIMQPPPKGSSIKLYVSIPKPVEDSEWQYLDFSDLLVQGATPTDSNVLTTYNNFQSGYRLSLEILSNPVHGTLELCEYKLGVRYKSGTGFKGLDSFSYRLVTEFGQKSEPACVYLHIGA